MDNESNGHRGRTRLAKVGEIKGQQLPPVVGGFLAALADTLDEAAALPHADTPTICLNLHTNGGGTRGLTVMRTEDVMALRRSANRGEILQ